MDFKLIHIEETDSTNHWLKEHASDDDVAVVAEHQTAGRGCGTNSWESEPGQNLTFSLLVHPKEIAASQQFHLSMAISLTIAEVLSDYFSDVSIKWPNDIYWQDCKICGILIENQLNGGFITKSIIGIGLNVNQALFKSDAPNPISMRQILGHEVCRDEVLNSILERFSLQQPVDANHYRDLLFRREGIHSFRDAKGTFEAQLTTVEDNGYLLLTDLNGNLRRYAFKEVQFII